MRGSEIIVSANPQGKFLEGYIKAAQTPKPGTIMQIDLSEPEIGGRFCWKIYDRDADGNRPLGPLAVLREDHYQGKTVNDAYAAGDKCFLYVPLAGEELNVLVLNLTGTADDHTKGTLMIVDDTTGKLIDTTGTPESEPFLLMENIVDPTADVLAHVMYTGY